MPAAIRSNSNITPPINQTNLVNGIKTAFTNAGFSTSPFDEYTSGTDKFLVYQIVFDAAKLKGTAYLRIKITSTLVISQQLYTGWTVATHTGTGGGPAPTGITLTSGSQVNFNGFNQPTEYRLIIVTQGTTVAFLGYVRPTNKPSWWEEDSFLFCFMPSSNSFDIWFGALDTPYWSGTSTSSNDYGSNMGRAEMASANPINSKRDVLAGLIIYSDTRGVAARSSDDIVQVASTGLTRLDTIEVEAGVEEYTLLTTTAGGLAVRTT